MAPTALWRSAPRSTASVPGRSTRSAPRRWMRRRAKSSQTCSRATLAWMGVAARPETSAFDRRALIPKRFRMVAVLGCTDSRVPPGVVFGLGLDGAFVIRVAGRCLAATTIDLRQLAVCQSRVKVLAVLGHELCRATGAAQLLMDRQELVGAGSRAWEKVSEEAARANFGGGRLEEAHARREGPSPPLEVVLNCMEM